MTDKKFTDEEIIETLERCSKGGGCFRCAMAYMHSANCIRILETECLDLVNRQKSEIEELNIQLRELWNMASLYKAESEIWEGYNENLLTANTVLSNEILEAKAKAEVEAYEEFAERLCEGKVSNDKTVIEAKVLLKEMVGEEE